MGIQGGINYNPELVPRQVGYPMILPPPKEAITPFIIYGMGGHAWKSIVRKEHEWGSRSCGASFVYKEWLKGRVKQIGLSYRNPRLDTSKTPAYEIQEAFKVEELEGTLGQIKSKQKALKRKLKATLAAQVFAQEEVGWE
ncbi:hypothetical protein CR513_11193, partial [Mucuna pruriens]